MRGIPCKCKCAADRVAGEEKSCGRRFLLKSKFTESFHQNNSKLLEASERGDAVSWARGEGHIRQIKSHSDKGPSSDNVYILSMF